MGKRGPKPWEPTDEERRRIRLYAGLGLTQEQIALIIGKCVETLVKQCRVEMAAGKAETLAKVAGSLVQKALGGDTASAIFYLKTQGGWRETIRNEHTGADGGPIETSQVEADADAFARSVARLAAGKAARSEADDTQH